MKEAVGEGGNGGRKKEEGWERERGVVLGKRKVT
jgi:hypothetical protein